MRKTHKTVIAVLALVSAAGVNSPVFADKTRVYYCEDTATASAKNYGRESLEYADSLDILGRAYHENGMFVESVDAFERAHGILKKHPNSQNELAQVLFRWARLMDPPLLQPYMGYLNGLYFPSSPVRASRCPSVQEKRKALGFANEALQLTKNLPDGSLEKSDRLVDAIQFFSNIGDKITRAKLFSELDNSLKSFELKSSDVNEKVRMAEVLNRLGNMLVSYGPWLEEEPFLTIEIIPDDAPSGSKTVKQSDFLIAEHYKLRALQLYDSVFKLYTGTGQEIEAEREMANWYRVFGKPDKERVHTDNLSKILKTHDKRILFPRRNPCRGFCGMG